jgi:hypothetical protein
MMTWHRKTEPEKCETSVTQCNLFAKSAVNDHTGAAAGEPIRQERGQQAMQTTTKDIMNFTFKDYAEELQQLIEKEQERSASMLRRIDQSMDVILKTERILKK